MALPFEMCCLCGWNRRDIARTVRVSQRNLGHRLDGVVSLTRTFISMDAHYVLWLGTVRFSSMVCREQA
jgi:hypothetical protein